MEERLLNLLESVLGKSKRTSGDNYAFYSPFVEHYKPKLEINIKLNSDGNNPWHCWISDEKGTLSLIGNIGMLIITQMLKMKL